MIETRKNTDKLLQFISEKYEKGHLDNDSLVKIIELYGDYLNLMTISRYAQLYQKSYNGARKSTKQRRVKQFFGAKFVIDNY
jgi:hypothetical protein